MSRKLIGIVKVYCTITTDPPCETYETIWPIKLFKRVHGETALEDRQKARTMPNGDKRHSPRKLLL